MRHTERKREREVKFRLTCDLKAIDDQEDPLVTKIVMETIGK